MSKFKTLICKAAKDADGTITAVASTPDVDRYGDVVAPSWDLEAFRANSVIMHGHDYEGPVIGKATEIDLVGEQLVMKVKFDESDTNPLGQRIANQFRSGFMSAFSVGFSPGKSTPRTALPKDHPAYIEKGAGQYFERNQLLEVSAVAIPANPHALAIRAKRWGLDLVNRDAHDGEEDDAPAMTTASVPAPEGHHWMDYKGGPVLMPGEDADHPGGSLSFEFEIVEEHDPERLKDEYQEAYGYNDDDEDRGGHMEDEDEDKGGHMDEDEDEEKGIRHAVRRELLRLMADSGDSQAHDVFDLFADSTSATGSDDFAALFHEGE